MRLFVAIRPHAQARGRLLALCDELRARSGSGRFVAPENLHLTHAFLGECSVKQVAAAKAVLDVIHFKSFKISMDRIGRFRRGGGDIWWVGVKASRPLFELQRGLAGALLASGFVLEKRPYTPHITLGREITTNTPPWPIEPFTQRVTAVALMKSERAGGEIIYTPLCEAHSEG